MKRHAFATGVLLVVGTVVGSCAAPGGLKSVGLRCEYLVDPLGIDVGRPRLSWTLESGQRAQTQTAYQILVANSQDALKTDRGDLWDSGKVSTNRTTHVVYAGKPLASRQECWWKVRSWDRNHNPSPWSSPAHWSMGLTASTDWTARWITRELSDQPTLADCQWVWFPEGDPAKAAPPGTRLFRRKVELPADRTVLAARLLMAVDNRCTLFVNGKEAGKINNNWTSTTVFDVRPLLKPGPNVFAVAATNEGSAPNPAGLAGKLVVDYRDAPQVVVRIDESWKAADKERADWLAVGFDDSNWASAKPLGKVGMEPWKTPTCPTPPLSLFRRDFSVSKAVARATVYICGLGFYELRLNGGKVGDRELDPGWTNYRKRCLYTTYDVTGRVNQGANAIGVMLGNGMYNVTGGRYVKFLGSFGPPKFILQLHLEYNDGTGDVIVSDGSWKAATGPIVFSCVYGGEDYDARLEKPNWDRPGFDDSSWNPVRATEGPGGALAASMAPPIKVIQMRKPIKVTEPKPGIFVYDLGQNASGRPQISIKGPEGATVKLITSELLSDTGMADQRSSGAPVCFSYTLKGEDVETWSPRFTYTGFRYVQVEGATRDPAQASGPSARPLIVDLQGQVTHAAAAPTGEFSCSNPLFNKIHEIIVWAIRSNMQSVLTDCPHREKLGWLEEAHLMGPGVMYNYDVPALYTKILRDMAEAQLDNGMVPDIAPEYTVFSGGFRDSPEWGSAYVIAPWYVYQMYGDTQILRDHYAGMCRYVDYLSSKAKDHIVSHGLGDWCDIGPNPPGESQLTPKGVTATATYYYDIIILEKVAKLLGKTDAARKWAELGKNVRDAFNRTYFKADTGRYATGSQCANAMAVVLGLAEPKVVPKIVEHIVKDVRAHGNRPPAGDVGHQFLLLALAGNGRSDVVFDMTRQTDQPGYGYQIAKGATSLIESWDARRELSQNHFMLGHIEEWFYKYHVGICPDPQGPGFSRVIIKPHVVGDLTWVKGTYTSIHGEIGVHWRREKGVLTIDVTIPANTTATVYVPAKSASAVTEGGRSAGTAEGVRFLRMEDGSAVYAVGSGRYALVVRE